ncbi:unnamed protein product, partial [Didymodactylos carnosus]
KLKRKENKLLLQKFREKDAGQHRKSRQKTREISIKMTKIRERNRARLAKRRLKLTSEKVGLRLSKLPLSSSSTIPKFAYKCFENLAPIAPSRSTNLSEVIKNNVIQFY